MQVGINAGKRNTFFSFWYFAGLLFRQTLHTINGKDNEQSGSNQSGFQKWLFRSERNKYVL